MSLQRTVLLVGALLLVALLTPSPALQAQDDLVREVAKDVDAPGSVLGAVKLPDVAAAGDAVHLAGNPNNQASYWRKSTAATGWSQRQPLGDARGKPDFSAAAVAVAPDGSRVCVAWIDRDSETISIRCRSSGSDFGPRRTIASADGFGILVKIAITSGGRIFAVWDAADRYRYSISSDGGRTWSSRRNVSDRQTQGRAADIATGPNGELLVGFYSEGDVYVGIWDGSAFDITKVAENGDDYFADPTVAIAPNGTFYIAWRDIDDGGVWYSERQPDGSWPLSRLASGGETAGTVAISADPQNNLHIFWKNNRTGNYEAYHAFKPVDENWIGPKLINVREIANLDAAASLEGGTSYGHAVYEAFDGGDSTLRYMLMAAEVATTPPPVPVVAIALNADAQVTISPTVRVDVTLRDGQADQIQLSNDGQTFSDYVALPEDGVISAWTLEPVTDQTNACAGRVVYARARDSATGQESAMVSDSIQVDPGVAARVDVRNPYLHSNPEVLGDERLHDTMAEGARDGDPNYTRVPVYLLEVQGLAGECSGLQSLTVGTDRIEIEDDAYVNIGALTGANIPFENVIPVTVADNAGQEEIYTETILVDQAAPQMQQGELAVVNASGQPISATTSILVSLNFQNMQITDTGYGEQEDTPFWGVWLANSTQNISPDDADALSNLDWAAVRVTSSTGAGGQYAFTVEDWSIFSGVAAAQRVGGQPFYLYAKILDGAGNPSSATLKAEVNLAQDFTLPRLALPLTER